MKVNLLKKVEFNGKVAIAVELDVVMTGKAERILFSNEPNVQVTLNRLLAYQITEIFLSNGEKISFERADKEKHYWVRKLLLIDRQRLSYHLYRDYNEGIATIDFRKEDGTEFTATAKLPENFDETIGEIDLNPIEISLDTEITLGESKLKDLILHIPTSLDLEHYGNIQNFAERTTAQLSRLISDSDGIRYSIEDWDNLSSKHRRVIATSLNSLPVYPSIIDVEYEGVTFKHYLDVESFFTFQRES